MNRTPSPTTTTDWWAFDRSDRWGLVGLLGLTVLAALWVWVAGPLLAWRSGDALPIELLSPVSASVPELDAAGVRHGPASVEVLLDDPTAAQRVAALAPGLVYLVVVVGACWLLWRFMGTVAAGDPFAPANVVRLRFVAGLLVFGTTIAFFADLSTRGALLADVDAGGLEPGAALSQLWLPVVTGMVVALVAEAFTVGSRLRDDVAGLV